LEQLAPKYRVYIRLSATQQGFMDIDSTHAKIGCTGCHGGVSPVEESSDLNAMNTAHVGMITDPSANAVEGCGGTGCHDDIVQRNATSIHTNLWGEKAQVAQRYGGVGFEFDQCPADVKSGYQANCSGCHTTCGQCHVSRPTSAGGGFAGSSIGGNHKFNRTPSEVYNCTACHGGRIGADWNGEIEGNQPDVHKISGLTCSDCHEEDFHGAGPDDAHYTTRYGVADLPSCYETCHSADVSANLYHQMHWAGQGSAGDISCFACHAQPYDNCNTCHAGTYTDEYNQPGGYKIYQDFKIGLNPNYGVVGEPHQQEKWIAVRHIPVSRDAFRAWGLPELVHYESVSTYKYTSPHNIQRWTSRTLADGGMTGYTAESCYQNCHFHGVSETGVMTTPIQPFYLLSAYLDSVEQSDEKIANLAVTVDHNGSLPGTCNTCHNN